MTAVAIFCYIAWQKERDVLCCIFDRFRTSKQQTIDVMSRLLNKKYVY